MLRTEPLTFLPVCHWQKHCKIFHFPTPCFILFCCFHHSASKMPQSILCRNGCGIYKPVCQVCWALHRFTMLKYPCRVDLPSSVHFERSRFLYQQLLVETIHFSPDLLIAEMLFSPFLAVGSQLLPEFRICHKVSDFFRNVFNIRWVYQ